MSPIELQWTQTYQYTKYINVKIYIPDYLRVAFTRVRVMSHNLKVETGRWSRTPTEQRICCCNENKVQDERHVLLECPISTEYRQNFQMLDYSSVHNLLKDETHCKNLCNFIYKVLNTYWYSICNKCTYVYQIYVWKRVKYWYMILFVNIQILIAKLI